MTIIEGAIIGVFIYIAVVDYKKRLITNRSIILVIVLGTVNKLIKYQLMAALLSLFGATMLFFLCMAVGYFYYYKKGLDIAGGGDYKLIAALGCVFSLEKLFLCLLFQLIFELIYRYVICPGKKHAALPLGASLGTIGAILLVGGI